MTKSLVDRTSIVGLPTKQRSRVTNGRGLFIEGDQRSAWSRRFRDLAALHAADMGGVEVLSEAKKSLIRRISTLEIALEKMESELASGGEPNMDLYSRISGQLRRLLETTGLERVARDVTPSIADVIAGRVK